MSTEENKDPIEVTAPVEDPTSEVTVPEAKSELSKWKKFKRHFPHCECAFKTSCFMTCCSTLNGVEDE